MPRKLVKADIEVEVVVEWDEDDKVVEADIPDVLREQVQSLLSQTLESGVHMVDLPDINGYVVPSQADVTHVYVSVDEDVQDF